MRLNRYSRFMENEAVAEVLAEIGVLLEIKGENPFKIRAYVNAARAIETGQAGCLPGQGRRSCRSAARTAERP